MFLFLISLKIIIIENKFKNSFTELNKFAFSTLTFNLKKNLFPHKLCPIVGIGFMV